MPPWKMKALSFSGSDKESASAATRATALSSLPFPPHLGMPSLESGRLLAEQRVDEDDEPEERSAALVVQGRLWYHGSLAKGLWVIDSTLPARTIVVGKQKQRKIDGCVLT